MIRRMMNHRMRHLAVIAVAAVAAITLSSCVTIPTEGPVLAGREVSEQEPGSGEVIPEGPIAGSSQEAILSGFLTAHSGTDNFDVARQFLSSDIADKWEPRKSVLVRTATTNMERLGENAITYNIVVSAFVDRDGLYTPYPLEPQTLMFQFVQEDGEWRISAAPDGIVLSARTFDNLFSPYPLYFLDPARDALVPDLRWFPGATASTRIVTALLNGPPTWLERAVGTAFPEGTQLSAPRRVPVEGTTALVDLTEEALAANEAQRQLMRLQLEASLSRISSVTGVEVSVGGTPLAIAPIGQPAPQLRPQVDPRMLVVRDGEFGYLANDRITAIHDLSAKVVATNPTEVTLGASGTVAATLGDGGAYLVQAEADEPLLVDSRPGIIAPTLDGYGFVWTVQRSDPGSIVVTDREGKQLPVQNTLPRDAEIVSLEVSRDGARIAALLATSAGTRLIVSSILRDSNQGSVPIALGIEPRTDLVVDSGTAIDATWIDELSVGVLSRVAGESEVVSLQVGGRRTDLGSPSGDTVSIVGGNNENGLRVLSADGIVSSRRGTGWQAGVTVSVLATQR